MCSLCLDDLEAVSDASDPAAVCIQGCCKAKHHQRCLDFLVEFSMKKGVKEVMCPICRQLLAREGTWMLDE